VLSPGRAVLITRPRAESEALAMEVKAHGREPVIEPLLEIVALDAALPNLSQYQALVFTSAHGVDAFVSRLPTPFTSPLPQVGRGTVRGETLYALPLYAVGEATEQKARSAGFTNIKTADGDGAALNRLLAAEYLAPDRPLLHPGGLHRAAVIEAPGLRIDHLALYEARGAASLSPGCLRRLDGGGIGAALFFSPRTGKIFTELLKKHARTQAVSSIRALCLSDSVLKSIISLPWADIDVAARPDQAALLALLD
jgi:uroporphyrinogen-III synthase